MTLGYFCSLFYKQSLFNLHHCCLPADIPTRLAFDAPYTPTSSLILHSPSQSSLCPFPRQFCTFIFTHPLIPSTVGPPSPHLIVYSTALVCSCTHRTWSQLNGATPRNIHSTRTHTFSGIGTQAHCINAIHRTATRILPLVSPPPPLHCPGCTRMCHSSSLLSLSFSATILTILPRLPFLMTHRDIFLPPPTMRS